MEGTTTTAQNGKIKTSEVLALLKSGKTRAEIKTFYGLSHSQMQKLFSSPSLKGRKTARTDFEIEDDLAEGAAVAAAPVATANAEENTASAGAEAAPAGEEAGHAVDAAPVAETAPVVAETPVVEEAAAPAPVVSNEVETAAVEEIPQDDRAPFDRA